MFKNFFSKNHFDTSSKITIQASLVIVNSNLFNRDPQTNTGAQERFKVSEIAMQAS